MPKLSQSSHHVIHLSNTIHCDTEPAVLYEHVNVTKLKMSK